MVQGIPSQRDIVHQSTGIELLGSSGNFQTVQLASLQRQTQSRRGPRRSHAVFEKLPLTIEEVVAEHCKAAAITPCEFALSIRRIDGSVLQYRTCISQPTPRSTSIDAPSAPNEPLLSSSDADNDGAGKAAEFAQPVVQFQQALRRGSEGATPTREKDSNVGSRSTTALRTSLKSRPPPQLPVVPESLSTDASTQSADLAVEFTGPIIVAAKASRRRGRDIRDQDDDNQVASRRSTSMTVEQNEAVNEYLTLLFESILQQAMKHVLKCWIRAIESKKQTNFPYVKGHHPDWWPDGVRYKEPDHQLKHERQKLFLHLLCPPDGNIRSRVLRENGKRSWIDMLRESTATAKLPTDDKKSKEAEDKKIEFRKALLEDMYYIGSYREKYWEGDIDGDSVITIVDKVTRKPAPKRSKYNTDSIQTTLNPASTPGEATEKDASEDAESWEQDLEMADSVTTTEGDRFVAQTPDTIPDAVVVELPTRHRPSSAEPSSSAGKTKLSNAANVSFSSEPDTHHRVFMHEQQVDTVPASGLSASSSFRPINAPIAQSPHYNFEQHVNRTEHSLGGYDGLPNAYTYVDYRQDMALPPTTWTEIPTPVPSMPCSPMSSHPPHYQQQSGFPGSYSFAFQQPLPPNISGNSKQSGNQNHSAPNPGFAPLHDPSGHVPYMGPYTYQSLITEAPIRQPDLDGMSDHARHY